MIISYFDKEKIIKSKKSISFKKIAKNGEREAASFYETKNQTCALFQKTKTKLLKKSAELYCLHEQWRRLKHDMRQPLSVVGLVAHDLQSCLEYGELDTETIAQNAQSLHNQVRRLDSMLDSIARPEAQEAQGIEIADIVRQYADDFPDSLSIRLDESARLVGQPDLVECLFYMFFEMFGQQAAQIRIDNSGAHFACEGAENLPRATLQTLLDAHNTMAGKQRNKTHFALITNASGGSLFFAQHAQHAKLANLTQNC